MKTRTGKITIPLVFFFLFVDSGASRAQRGGGGGGAEFKTIQLEFGGGTVGELVDKMREEATSVQILITPEASKSSLEPFKLNNVRLYIIMNMLQQLNPDLRIERTDIMGGTINRISLIRSIEVESIKHLIVNETQDGRADGRITMQDLLTAIEITLTYVPSSYPIDIKVHKETGLLIISGSPAQVQAVSRVVNELHSSQIKGHSIITETITQNVGTNVHALTVKELRVLVSALNDEIAQKTRLLREYEIKLRTKTQDDDKPK